MAGLFDDLVGAVGAVAQTAAGAQPSNTATAAVAQSTQDRLTALESFVSTWGPVIERLAPMIEKLATTFSGSDAEAAPCDVNVITLSAAASAIVLSISTSPQGLQAVR